MIPTIKTLLIYKDSDRTVRVLCSDFLDNDYRIENEIERRNPFQDGYDANFECYPVNDGEYRLSVFENYKAIKTIQVFVVPVLESNNRTFKLEEVAYDIQEFDF